MINEIVLGKNYKVVGSEYTKTPLFVHNDYVFYEYDQNGDGDCSYCHIDYFKMNVEEIPETPEEWFEVFYRLKEPSCRPVIISYLFKSKEDFLNYYKTKESDYEFIKLRKVDL